MAIDMGAIRFRINIDDSLFGLGQLSVSSSLIRSFENKDLFETVLSKCLQRHVSGDFGVIDECDCQSNMDSIKIKDLRVISRYKNSLVPSDILVITQDGYTVVQTASEY